MAGQKGLLFMGEVLFEAEQYVEKGRLAYYFRTHDADFWDQHLALEVAERYFEEAEQGHLGLGFVEKLFCHYLPRRGRTLEAGCGFGRIVIGLHARGYDVEGVDWASKTVKFAQDMYPDLPIRVGDVMRLDVPDGYYSGYISLGVIEHRREGPEPFLKEAYRVLEPGGVAFISVPYFNALRRLKARLGLYGGQPRPDGPEFWQYAFTEAEFTHFLQGAGFRILDRGSYHSFLCLQAEVPLLRIIRRVVKWRNIGWRFKRWVRRRRDVKAQSSIVGAKIGKTSSAQMNKEYSAKAKYSLIRRIDRFGNMLFMVCLKPKVSSYRGICK